ncbi:hypothetical protein [Promicromonospora panici]|uniref:hypothetical protein n=1 Tax=Promicromonospora panici TaxID=2219658 RepID=UPI00101E0F74|nr:hypothetical protein [Promicromonospora panici]
MKSIIVHSGLPKTGTSAVQAWLNTNRAWLAENGIQYPQHAADKNRISSGNALQVLDHSNGQLIASEDKVNKLVSEFEEGEAQTLFLSSEYFTPQVTELAALMPRRTRFILYVRDPLEFLESDYNQRVKRAGHTAKFVASPNEYGGWLGHGHLYRALDRATDDVNLELRPYHTKLFLGGTLLSDLLSSAGIEVDNRSLPEFQKINTSYTLHALEFKRALNHLPLGQLASELDITLQACPVGPTRYSLIPPRDYVRLRAAADDDLRSLRDRYGRDSLEPLRTTLVDQEPRGYQAQQLSDEDVETVTGYLARTAPGLVKRLAELLSEHPGVELPYPSIRKFITSGSY